MTSRTLGAEMILRKLAVFLAIVSTSIVWTFRDVNGDVCDAVNGYCKGQVQVPCSGGTCAVVSDPPGDGGVPGGNPTCADETRGTNWTATAATSWWGCTGSATGTAACTRKAATCMTVKLYKSAADCASEVNPPCFQDDVEECTADTATCTM
jgi:hypothetical protein